MSRLPLSAFCFFILAAAVQAQPAKPKPPSATDDPWLKAPYQLTLAVHSDMHPLLTDGFVQDLQSEVQNALQRDLGELAIVEVVAKHPLMDEVLKKGWTELDKRQFPVDDRKLHLVRVTYDNGQYQIQARQVDGSTGLVGPLRKANTPDRLWASRLVALTIAQDFGLIAKVGDVNDKHVRVHLRGGGATDPESIRVRVGEVFALAQIKAGRDGKDQGFRVPDALLYVTDVREGGEVTTRLFNRFANPLKKDQLTRGFRAIKLGTCQAPLRLRVVNAENGEPITGCGINIFPSGTEARKTEELTTNAQGRIRTARTYQNVVFVQPTLAGTVRPAVPIPLVDDQPVEIRLTGTQEAEAFEKLTYKNREWIRRLGDVKLVLQENIERIHVQQAKDEKVAVGMARELVEKLKADIKLLEDGLKEVREAAYGVPQQQADILLKRDQTALDALGEQVKALQEYIDLEENPTPARIALKDARIKDNALDWDGAIKAYEQSLKADATQTAVKARLDKLRAAWRIKNETHRKARAFIYDSWGKLEGADLEKGVKEAEAALKECDRAGDFCTALYMLKLNVEHKQKLASVVDSKANDNSSEAADEVKALTKVFESIQNLDQQIAALVSR